MIQSDEFREYLGKLSEYLTDYSLKLLKKNELLEHKAAHDMIDKIIKFTLTLSQSKEPGGAHPKVKLCVQNSLGLAHSRHLKNKLAGILKEFDDEPEKC